MTPQVFTATLFLLHLYLEPASEVPALAQTVYESVFAIEDVLTALVLLVQTVKVESPDRIHIIPSDPIIEKSAFSQRLVQLWSDVELGGNSLFMRLKNGIVLGVRGVQLLDFWLNIQTPEFTAIPDSSKQENSISGSLWQSMASEHSSTSDFLSIVFSKQTVVGSSINVLASRLCLCRFCCVIWRSVSLQTPSSFPRSRISTLPILTDFTIPSLFRSSNAWLRRRKSF